MEPNLNTDNPRTIGLKIIEDTRGSDYEAREIKFISALEKSDGRKLGENAKFIVCAWYRWFHNQIMAERESDQNSVTVRKAVANAKQRAFKPTSVLSDLARQHYLSRVLIDGQDVGDCTAGHARSWTRLRGVEMRFVELLTNGLTDDMVIREKVTEAEAAKMWKLAEKHNA